MNLINLEVEKIEENKYSVKLDIQPLANRLRIPKDLLAELMANALMNLIKGNLK